MADKLHSFHKIMKIQKRIEFDSEVAGGR